MERGGLGAQLAVRSVMCAIQERGRGLEEQICSSTAWRPGQCYLDLTSHVHNPPLQPRLFRLSSAARLPLVEDAWSTCLPHPACLYWSMLFCITAVEKRSCSSVVCGACNSGLTPKQRKAQSTSSCSQGSSVQLINGLSAQQCALLTNQRSSSASTVPTQIAVTCSCFGSAKHNNLPQGPAYCPATHSSLRHATQCCSHCFLSLKAWACPTLVAISPGRPGTGCPLRTLNRNRPYGSEFSADTRPWQVHTTL